MTKMEIMEPVESQQLYEFILNNKSKLPPTYKIRNMTLMAEQLREVYDMVATIGQRQEVQDYILKPMMTAKFQRLNMQRSKYRLKIYLDQDQKIRET